jgi:hypothetical protein
MKPWRKEALARPKRRWEDNIEKHAENRIESQKGLKAPRAARQ